MDASQSSSSFQLLLPCPNLRSKEMYYQPYGQDDDAFSSGNYWCGRTHEAFGPDNQPVSKAGCCPGRSCYAGPPIEPPPAADPQQA